MKQQSLNEKNSLVVTYEEKRQKNDEDGYKELQQHRQLLRGQRERKERECKRELQLQKKKDNQKCQKQMAFERQLKRE
ncbi:unnamed protein product [Rotaria sp. Silwood1]|nr:unnamed protein product [Rotaria sp. Silwood1]CAF1634808.1 unnamed protein product [Rotaria sp. Silwood1]CAF3852996.1 unnamed protein product [Rotaria sp. Silwood1]